METNDVALLEQLKSGALELFDSIRDVRIADPLPNGLSRVLADSVADYLARAVTAEPRWREEFKRFLTTHAVTMVEFSRGVSMVLGGDIDLPGMMQSAVYSHFQMQLAQQMKWYGIVPHVSACPRVRWEFRRANEAPFERPTSDRAKEAHRLAREMLFQADGVNLLDPLPPPLDRQTVDRILLKGQQVPDALKVAFDREADRRIASFTHDHPQMTVETIAVENVRMCVFAFVIAQAFQHLPTLPYSVFDALPALQLIKHEKEVCHGQRD